MSPGAYIAIGIGAPCLIIFILGFLWICGCLPRCGRQRKGDHFSFFAVLFTFDIELIIDIPECFL